MKSNIEKKVPYFSAYPLKALNLPEEEYQSQISLRTTGTAQTVIRVRVFPMANPYREKDFEQAKSDSTK